MPAEERYPNVFKPVTIGTCEIANRLFMPAVTTNMGERWLPSRQLIDYYEEIAAGGIGGHLHGRHQAEPLGSCSATPHSGISG